MAKKKIITEIVDPFFQGENTRYGQYEPKKQNRFLVKFPEVLGDITGFCVSSVVRPTWSPKDGWGEFKIKLHDLIAPSTSKEVFDAVSNYKNLEDKKIEFSVQLLDPTGFETESWIVNGELTFVDFGTLDYSSDDISYITLIVEPDWVNVN